LTPLQATKVVFVFRKVVFGKPLSKLFCVCLPLEKLVNGKHFPVKKNLAWFPEKYLPINFPFTLRPHKLKIDSIRTCKYKYTYFSPLENIQRRWGVCITYSFVLHPSIQQGVRCVWSLASSQTIYKKNPTGSWIWPRPPSPVPRPPSSRTLRPSPPAPLPWLPAAVTHEHSTNCHCSSNSHNLLIFLR